MDCYGFVANRRSSQLAQKDLTVDPQHGSCNQEFCTAISKVDSEVVLSFSNVGTGAEVAGVSTSRSRPVLSAPELLLN